MKRRCGGKPAMKTIFSRFSMALLLLGRENDFSQGTFVNLDFEHPVPPLTPDNFQLPATNAIPGWTGYTSRGQVNQVVYNTRPLDAAEIALQGTNSDSTMPIQVNLTVELFGASKFAPQQSAAIGQTGQIPANSLSLTFWGSDPCSSRGRVLPDWYSNFFSLR